MQVNVVTENISTFKALFAMLEEITEDEIYLEFKKPPESDSDSDNDAPKKQEQCGMKIYAMNTNRSLCATITLNHEQFTKYRVKDDLSCWLSITELNKCLKDVDVTERELKMIVEKDDNKVLKLVIDHKTKENRKEEYNLVFMECNNQITDPNKLNFDFKVTIRASELKKICTKAKKFSSVIKMNCDLEKIIFEYKINELTTKPVKISYGNDEEDVKIELYDKSKKKRDDLSLVTSCMVDDLLALKNSANITNTMALYLGENTPLRIACNVTNNTDDTDVIGKMVVYISPNNDS